VENVLARWYEIPEFEWRRYYLNQFTATAEMWLPTGAWEQQARPDIEVPAGTPITIGFDGSYNRDSTGLVACTIDGLHQWVLGVWERPTKAHDWVVPREQVDTVVAQAMRTYRVRRMACDPFGWHQEIADWEATYGDDVVVHWPTNEVRRLTDACSRFYTAVVTGAVTHDGDPTLARHLADAVVKETRDGSAYISKPNRASAKKIDLAIAAVIAHEQAAVLGADPAPRHGEFLNLR